VKGSVRGLISYTNPVVSQGTEENHEAPQSGQTVFPSSFEPTIPSFKTEALALEQPT
jgi:hypothetical protein